MPFLLFSGMQAIYASLIFSAIGLFAIGAAISISAKRFICSSTSNKALFLVTENGKIYALSKGEFKKYDIATGGDFTFVLKEISRTIDKPSDLRKHLKI